MSQEKTQDHFRSHNPATGEQLQGIYKRTTAKNIDEIMQRASGAFQHYRRLSGQQRALFLETIAEEIEALGTPLIERVKAESGLPEARLLGERGRTVGQLRLFAQLLREGSWLQATIDHADAKRQPLAKPDIRKMLMGIGPVVVFTASNFPLAFSTAGGDTASALAAGNPVIVKAHPLHPGTNELVSQAIREAAVKCDIPQDVFQSVYDDGFQAGLGLVRHPLCSAVAFTGSLNGGMALYKEAQNRNVPIPVFAEMGSINPVILLPKTVEKKGAQLSKQLAGSITLGAGQFCTNPGVIGFIDSLSQADFLAQFKADFAATQSATMLSSTIKANYQQGYERVKANETLSIIAQGQLLPGDNQAPPLLAQISFSELKKQPGLLEELFGPFSLLVSCANDQELIEFSRFVDGQLTASIFGEEEEIPTYLELVENLQQKVGRVIFNGVPTGVEVCAAMQHGGPFPASTDSRFSSVGTDAILRFVRPVAFQDSPELILPAELRDSNQLGIWRKVDGVHTRD